MTSIQDFYHKDCEKIDPAMVNAYLELKLDELNPTGVILDSSWGESLLDLTSVIKAGETQTYLKLDPSPNPEYLEYDGEDGVPQCIHGDDLSRIISLKYLKDVDQSTAPTHGDVYVYDGDTNTFKTFNLGTFVQNINDTLNNHRTRLVNLEARMTTVENRVTAVENRTTDLETRMGAVETRVTNVESRVTAVENLLTKPTGIPNNATVTWGNINLYSDSTNNNVKTSGFYTHNPSTEKTNDEYFA